MANRRYLYYARMARQLGGLNDIAEVFEKTANAETGHAFGHLMFLGVDPVAEIEINTIEDALRASIYGETYEWTQMYPPMACKVARRRDSMKSLSGSRLWLRLRGFTQIDSTRP